MPETTIVDERVLIVREDQLDKIENGELAFIKTEDPITYVTDAPIDGRTYVRKNKEWVAINL